MSATTAATPAAERIEALTGLRFVAAMAVVVEHFPEMIPGLGVVEAAQGGAGVSLFFVLSGFVLTHTYGARFARGHTPRLRRSYAVARVARIVPLHLVALAMVIPLVIALRNPFDEHGAVAVVAGLVANVFLVQAWFPIQVFNLWNGPAWSISVEMFFYAVFPWLIPLLVWPLARRRWLGRALILVGVVQVVVFLAISVVAADALLGRSGDVEGTRLIVARLANIPAIRLGEFVIGCLLGAAFRREYRDRAGGGWRLLGGPGRRNAILAACIVALVVIQFTPPCLDTVCYPDATHARALVDLRLFAVYLPVVVAIVAAVAWGPSVFSGLLASRAMVRLGEASYALYVLQWSAWLVINDSGPPTQLVAIVTVVGLLAVSLAAHRWIEAPARNWVNQRWSGRVAPAARPE